MTKTNNIRTLAELGEFGLIDHLHENIKIKNKETLKGIGDDAALIDYKTKQTLVTTDLLIEGVHFDLTYTPLKHLGYKAVAVNVSDIYAMNGTPKQITVSIAVSGKFTLEAIDELYKGINAACEFYNVDLIGGDTSTSITGLTISVTALGTVEKGKVVFRYGANVNDLICTTGDLGAAYAGLQLLEREKEVFKVNPNSQPDLTNYDYILQRILKPEAQKAIIETLNTLDILPTSMMDISDGLSSELIHICKQSNMGCRIYEDKIPIAQQTKTFLEEINIEPLIAALNGGEDYELVFTIQPSDYEKIKDNNTIKIIGHITEPSKGMFLTSKSGVEIELKAQGWNAYSRQE